ncbi:MAG: CPBP family intramembrane metalloprotease [Actinomycetota bacterium]|nr:CPBP family intramembrane metalloprotease [Actinomycetota bacterium]
MRAWTPWTAPAALAGGLVLALLGGLLVDIPALVLGVKISASHTPPGLVIADTFVQDFAFVGAAGFFAQLGGRALGAWQFGLQPTPLPPWRSWARSVWRAARPVAALLVAFLLFSVIWTAAFHVGKEKLLEQLGAGKSTILLLLSAGLTCVVAPICEEILFRGYFFAALRNWRGVWPAALITGVAFGGVHAGSAPALDLIPLAGLGVGLCLLYQYTGSLYPCIVAHALNNSLAFGSLENWGWQIPVLMLAVLGLIGLLALALMRGGVISPEPPIAEGDPSNIPARG